jgi:ATP synthase protein I
MAESNEKLDNLQRKIDAARSTGGGTEQDSSPASNDMGQAMRLSVDLVAGVLVGSAFGYFVDRWLHTTPLFLILCLFLGAAAGFKNMLRDNRKSADEVNK